MHGDLQRISVDGRRTVELGKFSTRQLVEHERIGKRRCSLGAERQAAGHIGRGDVEALSSRIQRKDRRRAGGAPAFGVIHYFRQIVVIDDGLGGRRLLPEAARYIPERSVSVLGQSSRGQREQEHSRDQQDKDQTVWSKRSHRQLGDPATHLAKLQRNRGALGRL